MVTHVSAFEGASKLVDAFTDIYNTSSNASDFKEKMHKQINVINSNLDHPLANVIISLAMVQLIKNNKWGTLNLVHDYYRVYQPLLFSTCNWPAVRFHPNAIIDSDISVDAIDAPIDLQFPLLTHEIFRIQDLFFKVKGIALPVFYSINGDVVSKALELKENEMIGVIAAFRERDRNHPLAPVVTPYKYTAHRCPILFHCFNGELRAYVMDSIVDEIMQKHDGDYFHSLQQDIIEQVCEIAPDGGRNIIFYRFPSVAEDRPQTPKINDQYYSNYKRQFIPQTCSIYAFYDLYAAYRLVKKSEITTAFDSIACAKGDNVRVFQRIPVDLACPLASLTRIDKHPDKSVIYERLLEKNRIHKRRNIMIPRIMFKYSHLAMVPDQITPSFMKEWKAHRSAPKHVEKEIRSLGFREKIGPLFAQLPQEVKEKVYYHIWEFNGGRELKVQDDNFGANNLFKDMFGFYTSLREAVRFFEINTTSIDLSSVQQIEQKIRNLDLGKEIKPLLTNLSLEVQEKVYYHIWELHGGMKLQSSDTNFGQNNLFADMLYFYSALRDAVNSQS